MMVTRLKLLISLFSMILMVLLCSTSKETHAQSNQQHKVLFISGFALLDPNPFEQIAPQRDWETWQEIKNFLKTSFITRNLNLKEDDFLYFSYSGEYERTASGTKDYTRPTYQRWHTSLNFANYDRRAEIVSEVLQAFPNARFDIIGHSLGGVVATYWAASRPTRPIPGPDPLAARVNSVITIDSPLRGLGGICNLGQLLGKQLPSTVVADLPNSVKNASVLTIRNKADMVVESRVATLDGRWRDLEDYLGNDPNLPLDVLCGTEAHGMVLKHVSTHTEIASALMSSRIVKPTTAEPADAGLPGRPNPIRIIFGEPKPPFASSNLRVKIGQWDAQIVKVKTTGLSHLLEVEVTPPTGCFHSSGTHDLTVIVDRGLLGREQDTVPQAVICRQPGPVPPTTVSSATILVIDVSGSMGESWRGGVKIESAKEAAQRFLSMLEAESKAGEVSHQVAIVTFSSDAYLNLGLTTDYARAKAIVTGLRPTAQTNIGAALQKANEALRQASGNPRKIIILLTDGMTNTGLPREQILSGPVAEAAQAGTCIYTIGFGEANNLNEAFLKQVAQATRCGQYYYGAAGFDLQNLYIKVRHESTGNIIGEFAGQVRQGETVTAGQVEVKPWQQELRASLNWPGSKLDLVVTDPRGRRLDRSYPGITIFAEGPLVYIIVKEPLAGLWNITVVGQEVPGSGTEYRVIASTVQGPVPQIQVNPALVASLGLMLLLVLAVVVGIAVSRRPAYGPPTPVARGAGLRVVDGPLAGTFIPFRGGMLTIGRAPGNTLTLPDPQVSHTHAHIVAVTGGLAIYDRNSRNGTFVNGQRVPAASLRPGNEIQVGNTRLRFEVYG